MSDSRTITSSCRRARVNTHPVHIRSAAQRHGWSPSAIGAVLFLLFAVTVARAAESLATATRTVDPKQAYEPAALYPAPEALSASPGKTVYYINPASGDDTHAGTAAKTAWRSFARLNALKLAPGDRVEVAPGLHPVSLKPSGGGTAAKPVIIAFAPGTHVFGYDQAIRRTYFISNACDQPDRTKSIAILIDGAHHLLLQGVGAGATGPQTEIVCAGRMALFINDHATGITYAGLTFDLQRPTVSEFRVEKMTDHGATIHVAEGSTYQIANGKFLWTGDWGIGGLLCQEAQIADGRTRRTNTPKGWTEKGQELATAKEVGERLVELDFGADASGLTAGNQWQMRLIDRDTVGCHNTRSKDITVRDCRFHALTNMGLVSQFTENLTFQHVDIVPPPGTLRTCPCWADCFHFSGCRGDILVESCHVSGTQDDLMNVHGTHLQVGAKVGDNQLVAHFANPQTFGFAAFQPGDEIAVIGHATLRELPGNPRRKVTAIERKSDKDWLLTLDGAVPAFGPGDVLDNITWYPAVTVRDVHVTVDSCRGLLLTTRAKVLVENCAFYRCNMWGISIEDDAEGWFESGPIRDLTVRGCTFTECGFYINPQIRAAKAEEPVHENIHIENNTFIGAGIFARGVRGLTLIGNKNGNGGKVDPELHDCSEVKNDP